MNERKEYQELRQCLANAILQMARDAESAAAEILWAGKDSESLLRTARTRFRSIFEAWDHRLDEAIDLYREAAIAEDLELRLNDLASDRLASK